jgi:hypothetical protein
MANGGDRDSQLALEDWADVAAGGVAARVGLRTNDTEALAGGPLPVDLVVEVGAGAPIYVAVGGDSAAGRPAFVSFSATLRGKDVAIDDPAAGVYIGGPVSAIEVAPGAPLVQRLLLNDYLRLERALDALAPGERGLLEIGCRRQLMLGAEARQALAPQGGATLVQQRLLVALRRDDAALAGLIERLAKALRDEWNVYAASRQAASLAQLVALRLPAAAGALRSLEQHPDPVVRAAVQRALARPELGGQAGGSS